MSLKSIFSAIALALVSTLGTSGVAHAAGQIGPCAIAASINDSHGRPVAGALVVASGPVERDATTGAAGIVTIVALPPGTYTLRATRSGFEAVVTSVNVTAGPGGIRFVHLALRSATFSSVHGEAGVTRIERVGESGDPSVAHALTAIPNVDVITGAGGPGSAAASVLATLPNESRFELDGIPIPGGATARNAVWFRNALVLDGIEVAKGPAVIDSSIRDTVGGVIDYRTLPIAASSGYDLSAGYDSQFGNFQRLRLSQVSGRLGFAVDTVAGGGENRSQVFKADYALSRATSVDLASYGSQSATTLDGVNLTSSAPAWALDLRSQVGNATLQVRSWRSSVATVMGLGPISSSLESDRLHGVQASYEWPLGANLLSLSFDRRNEQTAQGGVALNQTYTTATLRGDFQLSPKLRLGLGEALSGGTLVPRRLDPQVGLAFRASDRLTLRASAGGAFASAPAAVLAALPATVRALAPETSFGVGISGDQELGNHDRVSLSAFDLRRYDTFANLADARSRGVELGFTHDSLPGRIGVAGFVDLTRSYTFGVLQPQYRYTGLVPLPDGEQLPGNPYSKARLELTYRAKDGVALRLGTTYLGPNNPLLGGSGTTLTDAFVDLPVQGLFDVRTGMSNAFGRSVSGPLAPLYPPHEVTLSVVRSSGR